MKQVTAHDAAMLAAQTCANALAHAGVDARQVLVAVELAEPGPDGQDTALAPLGASAADVDDERVAELLYTHFLLAARRAGIDVQTIIARHGHG